MEKQLLGSVLREADVACVEYGRERFGGQFVIVRK